MDSTQAPALPRRRGLDKREPDRGEKPVRWLLERRAQLLASIAATAIAVGGLLHLLGAGTTGHAVWRGAVALLAAELTVEVVRTVIVEHSLGVDTIALVAMIGALALDQ